LAIIEQETPGLGIGQLLDDQLMFADAGRGHLGIDHQIMTDVVEDRAACQSRTARLLPERASQRLPG
jgi:hypothetical protein